METNHRVVIEDAVDRLIRERLAAHREFVQRRREQGEAPGYDAENYDFPVVTERGRRLRLYGIDQVEAVDDGYRAYHSAV